MRTCTAVEEVLSSRVNSRLRVREKPEDVMQLATYAQYCATARSRTPEPDTYTALPTVGNPLTWTCSSKDTNLLPDTPHILFL